MPWRRCSRIAAAHAGETVLVVTHGGAIRALPRAAEGLSYRQLRATGLPPAANCERGRARASTGAA